MAANAVTATCPKGKPTGKPWGPAHVMRQAGAGWRCEVCGVEVPNAPAVALVAVGASRQAD